MESLYTLQQLDELRRRVSDLEEQVRQLTEIVRGGAAAGAPAASEAFDVLLVGYPPMNKINVIKVLREITGLGLAESKSLSEANLPVRILAGADANRAERAARSLGEVGAQTERRPA